MTDRWISEEIPESWAVTRLEDICTVIRGGSPRPMGDPRYFSGDIPFVKIGDITKIAGDTVFETETHVNEEGAQKSRLLPKGSLVLSNSGTICLPIFLGRDACIHDGFLAFEGLPIEVNKKYLFYFFIYIRPFIIQNYQQGVTLVNLNTKIIGEVEFILPPYNEQNRVVLKLEEEFSKVDKGVEYFKTAQEQLKVYRQSVLKYAFEGKLTEEWREAQADQLETAAQLLERIQQERENLYQQQLNKWEESIKAWEENGKKGKKPSKPKEPEILPQLTERDTLNLPELPENWTWISLAHIKEFSMYGPRFSSKDYVDEGVAILRTTDVSDSGKVDWENSPKLLISGDEYEKYKLVEGDLLITRTGSIGTISVFNDDRKAIAGAFLIHYRLATHINSWFIFYFLKSQRAQNHFYEKSTGSGRPNLNVPNIELLAIPLPISEEQNKIVQILEEKFSVLDSFEATISETLKKVDVLRQSILKKAFSGHLVAQDPNDEPASILLKRIRAERLATPKPTNKISTSRKKPRKKEVVDLIRVLESANTWLSAQDVFQECGINGIRDEEKTDTIEKLYLQLRNLEKENRIEVDRRGDEDWLRIRPIGRS